MTESYTPALGFASLTPAYDAAIALLTRERVWRNAVLDGLKARKSDRILDVGCGTGSLVLLVKQTLPDADVHGIDPDPTVLAQARAKLQRAGLDVRFHQGFLAKEFIQREGPVDRVMSSLVLHQTPLEVKRDILEKARSALTPGGRLVIADYGEQSSSLMRALFRCTVQAIDGVADTQPNAEGILPSLMRDAGFAQVEEKLRLPTATGSISIYTATANASDV